MSKILIIEYEMEDSRGHKSIVCDHGIDVETMRNIVLPPEPPSVVGDYFSEALGGWVIDHE